jgi:hypothetical protein
MLLFNLSTQNFVADSLISRAFAAMGGAFLSGSNNSNYRSFTGFNFWTGRSELKQHCGDRPAILEEPKIISGRYRLKLAVP